MLTYLPAARLQEFDNTGKILNGGKIYTYYLQTTSPKTTYQDIYGQVANTNPIILDSVGSSDIYLQGSYTFVITDANDVPLCPPVDIQGGLNDYITSGGSGTFGDNIVVSVNTYNDVRALTNPYAWIFVQGRDYQGDGGQGLFFLDLTSTAQDDDGVVLVPSLSSGRYIRYNVTSIDFRWYGGKYNNNTIDQVTYLSAAEASSIRFGKPIRVDDSVYINSNFTTLSGTSWFLTDTAKLVSTLGTTFRFGYGSTIENIGKRVFGNTVQPKFDTGTTPSIYFSWMNADNVEGRFSKFLSASDIKTSYILDENITIDSDVIVPNNSSFTWLNGVTISFTKQHNINIPFIPNPIPSSAIYYNATSSIGSVTLSQPISPKFFCGFGGNLISSTSANHYTAFAAACKSGNVLIDDNYHFSQNFNLQNDVNFIGSLTNVVNVSSVSSTGSSINIDTSAYAISSNYNASFNNLGISFKTNGRIYINGVPTYNNCYVYGDSDYGFLMSLNSVQTFNNCVLGSHISTFDDVYTVNYNNVTKLIDPTKKFYSPNTSLSDLYLSKELQSGNYSNILVTSANGHVYGTKNLSAVSISADKLYSPVIIYSSATTTKIKFDNDMVYRNGVFLYQSTNYDIQANDSQIIEFQIINTTTTRTVTPANNPQGSGQVTIVNKTPGITLQISGAGTYLIGSVFPLPPPTIPGKTASIGYLIGGLWAFV